MRELLEHVLETLERDPARSIEMSKLAADPEITNLKKGVVAKFQNWLGKFDGSLLLIEDQGQKPGMVRLKAKRLEDGTWPIPSEL